MGKQISIYLDEDIQKVVQEIANKEQRSFSSMLNILLKDVLKKERKK